MESRWRRVVVSARLDPLRLDWKAAREPDPLRGGLRRREPRREGRPRRPQRRRQVHALPARHARGGAGRGAGLRRSRRDGRPLQPGRRRDERAQRPVRDDGRRRAGLGGGGGAARAGARARRSRARRRDGRPGRAVRARPGPLRRAGGLRARGQGAGDPRRPRLLHRDDGRRRRLALGRLEDARGAGPHPPHAAGRDAPGRADQPPGPGVAHLAGALPPGVRGRDPHDLARPRVHEPDRLQDHRDRRRRADQLLGRLRLLRARAGDRRRAPAGGLRPSAGDAQEGACLHRALQGPRVARGAGPVAREEARQDREGGAAKATQDGRLRVPGRPPLRRGRGEAHRREEGVRLPEGSTTGSTSSSGAASAGASWA